MKRWIAGVLLGVALALAPAAADAHPLGNFTVNHYLGVVVRPDAVILDYVIDMAEIPTFQERAVIEADRLGTAAISPPGSSCASTSIGSSHCRPPRGSRFRPARVAWTRSAWSAVTAPGSRRASPRQS